MENGVVKIITYHYVRDVGRGNFPGIKALSIENFKRQIEWINNNGTVIKQDQLLAAYEGKVKLASNSFLLTFDDGYIDHALNVVPVLEKYGMSGVFFLPTRAVVKRGVLDVNKIQFVLGGGHPVKEIIDKIFKRLAQYRSIYKLRSDEEYWETCAKQGRFDGPEVKFVKNMLQFELPEAVRSNIVNSLFEEYVSEDQRVFADELYLSADDAKDMKEKGMELASHGYDHVRLELLTRAEQIEEMKKSIIHFETLGIDQNNWTMCYPYGSYNEDTIEVLKSFGCKAAYTTRGGVTQIERKEKYQINRMDTNELMEEVKPQIVKLGRV